MQTSCLETSVFDALLLLSPSLNAQDCAFLSHNVAKETKLPLTDCIQ